MAKLVTDDMTDLQIDVLKQALNSYADYCVICSLQTEVRDNRDLASMWNSRGFIAAGMVKGIEQ